jgi:heme/copper-type cytochrome/quinol oxidase subunit 4
MTRASQRVFLIVGALLVVLTVIDFAIARNFANNLAILAMFALAEAGLVLYYFMHMYRLWRTEEH